MECCIICNSNINDEANYGLLIKKLGITIHHHCLYLMANIHQTVAIDNGIFGFSLKDIRALSVKISKQKCHYCKGNNAPIACQNASCKKWFHLRCGLDNDCLFQFVNEFNSYCDEHHNILDVEKHNNTELCAICFQTMNDYHPIRSIPNCCRGWTHVRCLRIFAFSAGYYFKCIQCHNPEHADFIKWRGVFVPEKDAIWEHRSAYEYLECNYSKCDALQCECAMGRNYVREKSGWTFIACTVCGSSAIHRNCLQGKNEFTCELCTNLLEKAKNDKLNRTYDAQSLIFPLKELPNGCSQSMTTQQISFMNAAHSFRFGIGVFDKERVNLFNNSNTNNKTNNAQQTINTVVPNHFDNNNDNLTTAVKCTAKICKCPSGRTHKDDDEDNNDGDWTFLICVICNEQNSMHKKCFTGVTYSCEICHPSDTNAFLLKFMNDANATKSESLKSVRLRSKSPKPIYSITASSIININNHRKKRKNLPYYNLCSSSSSAAAAAAALDKHDSDNNDNILNENALDRSHTELYQARINVFLHDKNEYLCSTSSDYGNTLINGTINRHRMIYDRKTNSYSEVPI